MEELFIPIKDENEVNLMNPLVWAYAGDCIHELYIRTHLINTTKDKVHELHIKTSQYVKATAQAQALKNIEDILTEEEKDIVRRTRNTGNHHLPKNVSSADYMYATAFEGLIGYLYLTKRYTRLKEILDLSLEKGNK